MKKISMALMLGMMAFAATSYADDMAMGQNTASQADQPMADASANTAKVYVCSMDMFASEKPGNCPLCGMKLEEKEMTAADVQKAIDAAKDKIKNPS